ncbi:RHS repeat domain-containing protein [Pseudomonas sp. Marseille-Q5117]|uniref:RHS repeat domain-containing protein n=1 Tax=Pseudomonas sp. Marseille-Q5117 TaxID=2972777 RepID=UPI0021C783D0|nr:RHS repeat-associated core domain-containing protein [Pseudomonas sp. Marseille-Q5117]
MNASVHSRTPSLSVIDGRGLPIRQVAYLRTVAGETPGALVTRQQHDVAGRLVAQHDPRLPIANATTVYTLDGAAVLTNSVDSGRRHVLPGLAGEPLQRWDERGHHWRSTFDSQLRVVAMEVTGNGQNQLDTFTYADGAESATHNRRGKIIQQVDPSGSLDIPRYAFTGQPLEETRTFHDGAAFTSQHVFSPLGVVLAQTDAGEHCRRSRYGLAGHLKQVDLWIKGIQLQPVLLDAQYNANDQIVEQRAGNGVLNQWTYDPADGRLHTQCSRAGEKLLQSLVYFYDRVGNVVRIEDPIFKPVWFANQLIDGHREFNYDSLYRLIRATGYDDAAPSDIPGWPTPTDPKNRLNYIQSYKYDDGDNLIELCHVRDGNTFTRQMCIDPNSNRGVRWKTGDAPPDFDTLFDPHGNQRTLKPGPTLQWNARDELESVPLVIRKNSNSDAEHYRYSQGQRVFKCHEWFTGTTRHFHQVRYLPGLEIRTKDDGEELHVISLGNARCLHWISGRPGSIENNQMRYSQKDHLGSCVMELDQQAYITSKEGYYSFGGTAWMAARNEVEVRYKFIRYSGKEMDFSGLYYYGARYYAPWLQRWVSADPAGDVDGLNLYRFVGNNPLTFVDVHGNSQEKFDIVNFSNFVTTLGAYSSTTLDQILNVSSGTYGIELLANAVGEFVNGAAGFIGGYFGAIYIGAMLPNDPHIANFTQQSKPPFSEGLIGGNIGGDIAGAISSQYTSWANLIKPLIPQTSAMSVAAIDQKIGITESSSSIGPPELSEFLLNRGVGSVVPGVGMALSMASRVQEAEDIKNGLDPVKIEKIETMLADWKQNLTTRRADIEKAFRRLGQSTVNPSDVLPNASRITAAKTIRLDTLLEQTSAILGYIESSQTIMKWYKEDLLTDNRFLRKQAKPESNWKKFQKFVLPFTKHKYK